MKGNENINISETSLKIIKDSPESTIMHIGEKSLMNKLAEIATKNGGDILEIGFGMHLSADSIQSNPNVTSHTIIEVHSEVYKSALEWAKDKKNVEIILGDWIDILPLKDKKFDGVLHDTHLDDNIPKFLDYVKDNCKKGTIVAFFENPVFDSRLNGIRFSIPKEEFDSLPYKNSIGFIENQFELKYTTFNGIDFYQEKQIKKII